jgi:hypothetical protein
MEESNKMIKDSSERLGNAYEDLRAIIVSSISVCSDSDLLILLSRSCLLRRSRL